MSKIYYGDRASGGSLKHYRTKGSRNGYSKNPNYKVVGQRAKGKWVNGRYVYDQPTNNPMYSKTSSQSRGFLSQYSQGAHQRISDPVRDKINEKAAATKVKLAAARGSQNNWQRQAIKAAAQGNLTGKIARGEVGAAKANNGDVYSARELGYQGSSKSKKSGSKSAKSRPPHEALRIDTPSPDPSSWRYTTVDKTAMGRRVDTTRVEDSPNGGTRYATEIVDPRYNVEGSQKIEKAKQEAARKAKEKETKGQYFTFDEKTGRTVKTSPGIEAEKARIEAGKKRHAKVRAKRERAAKRAALINKIKDKISSFFKKKK